MSVSSDSKKQAPLAGNQQAGSHRASKEAESSPRQQQNRTIMATIADDDDRLLVRIGYTPVRLRHTPKRDALVN